ncbi:hypothetical protein TNCT_63841 [Trichonephila clavata]|uniref:Uncharacterized protein n=1 Tax=Trichonephila clavata TaxID=2740835 RepID=A0A8X6L0Z3_TRICU|nr:hypothetical protein TNCT_63841 [Trichonephila clavata]
MDDNQTKSNKSKLTPFRKMAMFYIVSALLGVLLIIIKYSFWRKQLCQNLPGIEPGFFNIPGDLTTIFLSIVSKDTPTVLEKFQDLPMWKRCFLAHRRGRNKVKN